MHTDVCVRTDVHACICIHLTFACACACVSVNLHMRTCVHAHTHIYIYIYIYMHAWEYTCACACVYVCMCLCLRVHVMLDGVSCNQRPSIMVNRLDGVPFDQAMGSVVVERKELRMRKKHEHKQIQNELEI